MRRSPLPWLGALLAAYLLAPFIALFFAAAPGAGGGLHEPGLWSAIGVSIGAATVSAALIALFGIPLGYVLARGSARWLRLVEIVVQLPLAIPPLASGILLLFLVGPYTLLGRLTGGALTDSFAGIVIAQTFVAAPFLVIAARSAFAAVDPELESVAATLGHSSWARFCRVSLPLAWPGIQAGALLAWVRAFGEFGATVTLAYHPYSLPVYTYVEFGSTGLAAALPPVVAAVAAALLFLALTRLRPRKVARAGTPGPPQGFGSGPPPQPSLTRSLAFEVGRRIGTFDLQVGYVGEGRRLVLVGPSGSGKSLTLRLLAGLDRSGRGFVRLGERALQEVPPEERRIGYVPQDYGLMPHLTVWQQATFGVDANPSLAWHWLERLGIESLWRRLPRELSGGQRQRVALARALASQPHLLLLDEPLSALDAPERERLQRELRLVQREAGITTVIVTHDPAEARLLADDLLVLSQGRVVQRGPVEEVFAQPETPLAASLLGIPNVFSGLTRADGRVALGSLSLEADTRGLPADAKVVCSISPGGVQLVGVGGIGAVVLDAYVLDGVQRCFLRLGALDLEAAPHTDCPPPGSACRVAIAPSAVRVRLAQ